MPKMRQKREKQKTINFGWRDTLLPVPQSVLGYIDWLWSKFVLWQLDVQSYLQKHGQINKKSKMPIRKIDMKCP